jgi:uncharacterized protein YdcH (DUF465 family)
MYENRIKHLEEAHRVLDKQIGDMERNHPHVEESKVAELKKQKLQLKDEIARLHRLQWEHDHETIEHSEHDR